MFYVEKNKDIFPLYPVMGHVISSLDLTFDQYSCIRLRCRYLLGHILGRRQPVLNLGFPGHPGLLLVSSSTFLDVFTHVQILVSFTHVYSLPLFVFVLSSQRPGWSVSLSSFESCDHRRQSFFTEFCPLSFPYMCTALGFAVLQHSAFC